MGKPLLLALPVMCFVFSPVVVAGSNFPDNGWKQYNDPREAGFSTDSLHEVSELFERLGGASLLIVHDGAVVLSLGNPARKLMDHSMRKSYLSALFGMYTANGQIRLDENLGALGIDDMQGLTHEEKQATVGDLLSSRSGVYHPAAYSPKGMVDRLPARGSHTHGSFWFYNNWDFNALGSIFTLKTGEDVFEAFGRQIAAPLGMEDFRAGDTYYRVEEKISRHKAYLFRLSARDEARFGLLYLNNGKWKDKHIIPAEWVKESTSPVSTVGLENSNGYGYLWWTSTDQHDHPFYYASGVGPQRIAVVPAHNLVIVHSTDTYAFKDIPDHDIDRLVGRIINAHTGIRSSNPRLKTFVCVLSNYPNYPMPQAKALNYPGTYVHPGIGSMEIVQQDNQWLLNTRTGVFQLHAKSETEFVPEDIEYPVVMVKSDKPDEKGTIKVLTGPDQKQISFNFFY